MRLWLVSSHWPAFRLVVYIGCEALAHGRKVANALMQTVGRILMCALYWGVLVRFQ